MSWTEEQIGSFQSANNIALAEINASLRPDEGEKTGKIGIFLFGQVGDLATAMSVLNYRRELWPNKDIIWYANSPNADLLRYAPIKEVRPWVWSGNGLPLGTPDFYPLLCNSENRLNKELAKNYALTADLDEGYFPAPHMMTPEQRHGYDYPNVSRKVFGIDKDKPWHPLLSHSLEEVAMIENFYRGMNRLRRTVMLETFCGSGQSIWDDAYTRSAIDIIRSIWGPCNFVFASHKNHDQFSGEDGYYSCSVFTPRQTALMINHCDLFLGISSGISVVTSAIGLKPVPKIQCCGSFTCSTVTLATGDISLLTSDDLPNVANKSFAGRMKFESKLKEVLIKNK